MASIEVFGHLVHGAGLDAQTRCTHYALDVDVIALKHACCGKYYPCHACHAETAGHDAVPWPVDSAEPAVLCGVCGHEMTARAYLATAACPACAAGFNPGCKNHAELYFDFGSCTPPACER